MYQVTNVDDSFGTRTVYVNADGGQFEADESNRDYQAYLAWVAEGNTPQVPNT